MAYDVKKVLEVQRILYETDVVSLNTVIKGATDDGHGDTELGDFVPSEQSMEDEICEQDKLRYLLTFINKLSPREQLLIRMRFGLDDNNPKTLEEVGSHFGVTRERARQVEAKALRKLRKYMSAAGVDYNSF